MSDILHDSPREFLSDAASGGRCDAQSVVPLGDGSYACGCCCQNWYASASSIEDGLELAREHVRQTSLQKNS